MASEFLKTILSVKFVSNVKAFGPGALLSDSELKLWALMTAFGEVLVQVLRTPAAAHRRRQLNIFKNITNSTGKISMYGPTVQWGCVNAV